MAWLATEAPGAVRRFMGELESGSLKVDLQPRGFEPSLRRLERIGNRLVLGMIVAALIVGLGVSASVYHPAAWASAFGTVMTVGFILAAVLGVALAWSVFRSSPVEGERFAGPQHRPAAHPEPLSLVTRAIRLPVAAVLGK